MKLVQASSTWVKRDSRPAISRTGDMMPSQATTRSAATSARPPGPFVTTPTTRLPPPTTTILTTRRSPPTPWRGGPAIVRCVKREDWDARYSEKEFVWTVEPNRFVVAETSDLTPRRALDLACGEGRNAVWLAARGWNVTAPDFSSVAIEKAQALAAHRGVEVAWEVTDVRRYMPPAETFHLVIVVYLQMPAEELHPVLARAAAAVAPGGTMLVVSHDLMNLTQGHGGPKDPAVLTTPNSVAGALAGLVIERAERVERPVDGADRPAIDTLVRASR